MQEHLSDSQIQNYQEQKITPEQLLQMDDHLQKCEPCRTRLTEKTGWVNSFESLRSDLRKTASAETGHVSYEELERFVVNELDSIDRENIQSHLYICHQCKAEEQDLRSFQTELHQKVTPGKVIAFWRSPAFSISFRITGAAAALVFFIWLAEIPMKNQIKELQTQLRYEKNNTTRLLNENRKLQEKYARISQFQKSAAQAPLLVALNDGNAKIQLDQQGNLAGLPELPAFYQQKIVAALTRQQAETPPFLRDLIGKPETLMGNANASNRFSLFSPVSTVVQSDRPTFQWMPLKGAETYRLYIHDVYYNEIAVSPLLKETAWTVSQILRRGIIYNWQVIALKGGKEFPSRVPPTPEAKFQVLSKDKFKELERMKQVSGNSHLVMGIVDAQYGLLDDAEREFTALSQDNVQSTVAKKLLHSVQSVRQNSK